MIKTFSREENNILSIKYCKMEKFTLEISYIKVSDKQHRNRSALAGGQFAYYYYYYY